MCDMWVLSNSVFFLSLKSKWISFESYVAFFWFSYLFLSSDCYLEYNACPWCWMMLRIRNLYVIFRMLHKFLFFYISWKLLLLLTFKKANKKLYIIMSNCDGLCTPVQIRTWGTQNACRADGYVSGIQRWPGMNHWGVHYFYKLKNT